jgi:hypothetical protein
MRAGLAIEGVFDSPSVLFEDPSDGAIEFVAWCSVDNVMTNRGKLRNAVRRAKRGRSFNSGYSKRKSW